MRCCQKNILYVLAITVAFALCPIFGCKTQTHPWAGTAYEPPSGYTQPHQEIYAPMPTNYPSVRGTAQETDESLELELDLLLERD